ncbi:MAG TPA: NAD(P)-dependent alcohol dehydrogenase [Phycisphaerae bacterium]|nr:NAD(P)-dependent alcohol dehydrogenase [Phycisphaerae bacterium]
MSIKAYAAHGCGQALEPFAYEPPPLGPHDVDIAVTHCGICHSDVHMIDNDWKMSRYPLVPGHEVVGTVAATGSAVTHLKKGQRVGLGWQSGSCMECEWCIRGDETCCPKEEGTIVGRHGGFAGAVRADGRFAIPIPEGLSSETAAPLLCGGVTVYTPLKTNVQPASRVGVIGIGGLGHMAIRFAHAMGCEVTAFSTSPDKRAEAKTHGADNFVVSTDAEQLRRAAASMDVLISAVTVDLDWEAWLKVLRPRGTLALVGASPGNVSVPVNALIVGKKSIQGSAIGNRSTIREMLEFAARHGIGAQTEVVPMSEVNAAINKVRTNRARYRMVLKN